MGDCVHPRSQSYEDDQHRSRCGACGDVWDNDAKMFVPIDVSIEKMEPYVNPPRVIVADIRHGKVRADGTNIDLPEEGQQSMLRSLETADVIVEIHDDNVFVKTGYDKHIVLLMRTKSALQLNAEKADRELAHRTGDKQADDLEKGDHPVDQKFARIWDGSVPSGTPVKGGLKGY
jgi:hypothetical protein